MHTQVVHTNITSEKPLGKHHTPCTIRQTSIIPILSKFLHSNCRGCTFEKLMNGEQFLRSNFILDRLQQDYAYIYQQDLQLLHSVGRNKKAGYGSSSWKATRH